MKISVVITTYKEPVGLRKAIDSVILQNCDDLEIIVVDDNGEGSIFSKMVLEILNDFSNIKYLAHKFNKNSSAARNTGIKAAQGEYIALLDDDDWFLPGKIQKQVKALDNLDSDIKICVCWYRMIEGDGSFIEKKYTFEKNPSLQILWNEVIFTTSTMMFSKKLWEKLDGFNETFRRRQDIEFLVRACAVGEAYIVNEILCERLMLRRNLLNDMNEEIINLDLLKTSTRYIYENSNPKLFNKTTDVFNEIIFRLWIKKNEPIKAVSYMLSCGRSIGCFKEAIIRTLKNKIHRLFKKAI